MQEPFQARVHFDVVGSSIFIVAALCPDQWEGAIVKKSRGVGGVVKKSCVGGSSSKGISGVGAIVKKSCVGGAVVKNSCVGQ